SIANPHTVAITKDTVFTAFFAVATAQAYDFSAENEGKTIFYNITSYGEPMTAEVMYETTAYNSYSGAVVIPATVTNEGNTYIVAAIGASAFKGCTGLTSVTLPNILSSIGADAFSDCTGLTVLYAYMVVPVTVESSVFSGVSTGIAVHIPCGSTAAYQAATGWSGLTTNFVDDLPLPTVTVLSADVAMGSVAVTQVNTCGNGNTAIIAAMPVFKSRFTQWSDGNTDNPRTLAVPKDTTLTAQFVAVRYDFYAINDGHEIYYNVIPASSPQAVEVTHATDWYNSYSGAVVIPATVTNLGETYNVTTIGEYAFVKSSDLTAVTIPESVTTIGFYGFRESGLTSVTIPSSVDSIGTNTFSSCKSLETVIIGNGITAITTSTFAGCTSLKSVTLPSGLVSIGRMAFTGCTALSSLTLPSTVETIGDYAFQNCSGLTELHVDATTPPAAGTDAFRNVPVGIPVYIPCGTLAAYQSAARWSSFTNFIADPLPVLFVQSANDAQGSVAVTQINTCTNNTAIIAATPLSGYQFVQWNDGNTDNPRTVTVTKDTTFTATFDIITGIEGTPATALALYPNPVRDELFISGVSGDANVEITDLSGRTIGVKNISPLQTGEISINVSHLAKGVYFVRIGNAIGKFVKE
ncbi:MAG: leucine-rich repeat protein, partial [Prevotellaceae bacterium]|nr:leucine-rich repeat protein [Prevotellaceae bacterium]